MPRQPFPFDDDQLRRVLADPAHGSLQAKAAALGCSRTTLQNRMRKVGLRVRPVAVAEDAPVELRGHVCPDRARQLFQAVLLEMWRVALHLSFDKCSDYERAAARRWFGSPDFDLVCLFAGVDPDTVMSRFRAARKRLADAGRTPNSRRTALERIAA